MDSPPARLRWILQPVMPGRPEAHPEPGADRAEAAAAARPAIPTPTLRLALIGALAATVIAACDGNGVGPPVDCPWPMGEVCGEWRLVRISGGLGSPPPVSQERRLTLRPDSTFAMVTDTVRLAGRYDVLRYDGPDNIYGDSIWLAEFVYAAGTPVAMWRWRIRLIGPDTLQLSDLFVDGFQYDHARVAGGYR